MEQLIDVALLGLLAATAIAVIGLRDLFAMTMMLGIYSLLSATLFVVLDAVDVAFTEAAVGAGVSAVLMLGTLALTGRQEATEAHKPLLPLLVVIATGAALVYGTLDMPRWGDPQAPIHQHVAPRYIQDSPVEVGVPNMVTSVLASYRGYDTLGETTVIFTAGIGVLVLLGLRRPRGASAERARRGEGGRMRHHVILNVIAKLAIPLVLLFALYVQFHGDYGPGGGFQAGVIFAAAIILYSLIFGLGIARQLLSRTSLLMFIPAGVLLFSGVGLLGLLLEGDFLEYNVLSRDPVAGQHLGILLVELGVGITVASVMVVVFFAFAGRGRRDKAQGPSS